MQAPTCAKHTAHLRQKFSNQRHKNSYLRTTSNVKQDIPEEMGRKRQGSRTFRREWAEKGMERGPVEGAVLRSGMTAFV